MQALLLIDIQNDYFPGGRMELFESEAAGVQAGKLLDAARKRDLPVFHIQHLATRPDATFFLPGTDGARFHKSVTPLGHETVVQKHYPNAFRETALLQLLREAKVTELIVTGMMTQMCVDTTVRAAADLGFACRVAHDACATRDLSFAGKVVHAPEVQTAFMAALNGFFAEVLDVASLCSGLK